MAQWLGQFSGRTHKTAVSDAEHLLEHAVSVFNQASVDDRAKKAKAVLALAKRVFAARVRFLKATIAATTDPSTSEAAEDRARQLATLEAALRKVASGDVDAVVREFAGAAAQALGYP